MVNAWTVGGIVAVIAGLVGFFVVLRGSAFAAHAVPNGSFAGAAGAVWLNINVLAGLGRLRSSARPASAGSGIAIARTSRPR